MADESDVETALVALSSAALYPNGANSPSVPGPDCRIYRGWPNSAALDADLTAGRINVTVFAVPVMRAPQRDTPNSIGQSDPPTLTVSVSGYVGDIRRIRRLSARWPEFSLMGLVAKVTPTEPKPAIARPWSLPIWQH